MEYPNWFNAGARKYFEKNLLQYSETPLRCLQLGAYTGDATEWLFSKALLHPDSTLTDVDTWEGSNEAVHKTFDWNSVESVYLAKHQDKIDSGKLKTFKGTTDSFFESGEGNEPFDFIYVDADHEAASVLKDGLNAIYRLKVGGIIAFDDYIWSAKKGAWADPKPAIDAIMTCYSHKFKVIDIGLQVWLQKIEDLK
jgi:predicted O-methyltransferase YrrM